MPVVDRSRHDRTRAVLDSPEALRIVERSCHSLQALDGSFGCDPRKTGDRWSIVCRGALFGGVGLAMTIPASRSQGGSPTNPKHSHTESTVTAR